MNEQINNENTWWDRNKKKVFVIGGIALAVGVGVVVFKNHSAILALLKKGKTAAKTVKPITQKTVINATPKITAVVNTELVNASISNNKLPIEVNGFIRTLPEGWHASPKKIAQALELGIELGENQTLVDAYIKNVA